jgi:hypothetical protein
MALKQLFWSIRLHKTIVLLAVTSEAARKLLNNSDMLIPVHNGNKMPCAAGPFLAPFKPLPRRKASNVNNNANLTKTLDPTALGCGSVMSPLRPIP